MISALIDLGYAELYKNRLFIAFS